MFMRRRENPENKIQPVQQFTAGQLLEELTRDLEGVEQRFNQVTDPDMIDSYIYERAALMARLRYLLRTEREGETPYPRLIEEEANIMV